MSPIGAWQSSSGIGATTMGGMGYAATLGGLGDTGGLYDTEDGFNGRAIGLSCLKTASACASGASTFASSASASGAGAAAGAALGLITDAVGGGLRAYDAHKCMADLERHHGAACALWKQNRSGDAAKLVQAIDFCMEKQQIKRRKGIAGATIVGQPFVHLYKAGRAAYKGVKGTKGVERRAAASNIVEIAKKQTAEGFLARLVVASIMKTRFEDIAKNALADAMKSG